MSRGMRIKEGRECVLRQKWGAAYTHFSAAEQEAPLDAEDLEQLTLAAHLTGKIDESIDLLSRTTK